MVSLRRLVRRYYAICCQPLVYRQKMTPSRVALMIGGCWVIPTFISFLPIMQGWNSIGIDHVVSLQDGDGDAAGGCELRLSAAEQEAEAKVAAARRAEDEAASCRYFRSKERGKAEEKDVVMETNSLSRDPNQQAKSRF